MNFANKISYTPEQEHFRQEVAAWVKEHGQLPPRFEQPRELADMGPELYEWVREYRRKLGRKGWLAPLWPKELGGGGLSTDMAEVLAQELENADAPRIYDNRLVAPALMVWGTPEQKKRFLPRINTGEVITWQAFSEPEAGSDAASIKTTATRSGDSYIVNGTKVFIGGPYLPDYLWTTVVTDPNAPRHRNMGALYVPANLPGISYTSMELIVNTGKRFIHFDDVRVPAANLIGAENNGWRVAQTSLEIEHGAGGNIGEGGEGRGGVLSALLQYAKETHRNGVPISKDPYLQQLLVQAYIDTHAVRLIALRNYWMFNNKDKARSTYHGSQSSLMRKELALKMANTVLEVVGPYALLDDPKWAPLKGVFEEQQRQGITAHHPGGTTEIQRLIMARRLGLSRTREEAAPAVVA